MANNYPSNLDYIAHGWGKKPDQKQKEKEYNHWYYENRTKKKLNQIGVDDRSNTEITADIQKKEEAIDKFLKDNSNPVTDTLSAIREALNKPILDAPGSMTAYAGESKKKDSDQEWVQLSNGQWTLKKKK